MVEPVAAAAAPLIDTGDGEDVMGVFGDGGGEEEVSGSKKKKRKKEKRGKKEKSAKQPSKTVEPSLVSVPPSQPTTGLMDVQLIGTPTTQVSEVCVCVCVCVCVRARECCWYL